MAIAALAGLAPASSAPAMIRVGITHGASYDIVSMPLETYVARVLAGEAAAGSSPAALQALAITVRTFALANLGRHRVDGFDMCDQTHCQVVRTATALTEQAAQATSGQVLLYRGAPASVYYSASCGGHTELASAVWPGADDPPYLPSRKDDACEGEPAWTDEIAASDLRRALAAAGFRGSLREMRIADHDGSGRVSRLSLDGLTPSDISGQDLRAAVGATLGWQHVKSAVFDLRRSGDVYQLSGHGSGHGVGLCVIGSVKLGAAGESATQILNRYFPGLAIGAVGPMMTSAPAPAPAAPARAASAPSAAIPSNRLVTISLPDGDQGEHAALVALVSRARDDLSTALGVSAPAQIVLRFHATTNDYERATGRAWFTSAAVVNHEVHLVPLASLRDRGVLDGMIRRQLVHVMADEALAGRPAWVREGASLFFGDPGRELGSEARGACPTDAELLRPVSPGALGNAFARARSCFARQIAAGRSWRDVK